MSPEAHGTFARVQTTRADILHPTFEIIVVKSVNTVYIENLLRLLVGTLELWQTYCRKLHFAPRVDLFTQGQTFLECSGRFKLDLIKFYKLFYSTISFKNTS